MGRGREGQYYFTYPSITVQHPSFVGGTGRGSSPSATQPVFKRTHERNGRNKKIV